MRLCHLAAIDRCRILRAMPRLALELESPSYVRFEPAFVFGEQQLEIRWLSAEGKLLLSDTRWVNRDTIAVFLDIPFGQTNEEIDCEICWSGCILGRCRLVLRGAPSSKIERKSFVADERRKYYRTYEEVSELPFEEMLILTRKALERVGAKLTMVTGSVGKTSTKELVSHLSDRLTSYSSTDSWNFPHDSCAQILLNCDWAKHFVLEMAVGYHLPTVGRLLPPDVLIFTELGAVHIARFENLQEIGALKASLAAHMGKHGAIVWNADNPEIGAALDKAAPPHVRRTSFSSSPQSSGDVAAYRCSDNEVTLHDRRSNRTIRLSLPERLTTHPANIAAAYCARCLEDSAYSTFEDDLVQFEPPPRRLEIKTWRGVTVVNDGYNANPISMIAFLDALSRYKNQGLVVGAIIAEMADLGSYTLSEHSSLMHLVNGKFDHVIFVGPTYTKVATSQSGSFPLAGDARTLAESALLDDLIAECDVIGVKGSYCTNMQIVMAAIQHKIGGQPERNRHGDNR